MNSDKIKLIGIFVVALLAAVYLGTSAATSQGQAMVGAGIVVVLLIIFLLGRNLWLLIPSVLLAELSFRFIPGNLSFLQVATLLFVGFTPVLLATRRIAFSYRFNVIHFCGIMILAIVAQGYFRNPVGLALTGSANVGARPYVDFALAFMTFAFLAGLRVEKQKVITASKACIGGGLIAGVLQLLALIPGLALPLAYAFGTTYSLSASESGDYYGKETASRNFGAVAMGDALSRVIVSKTSPLNGLFSFRWSGLIVLSVGMAAYGGFRSKLFGVIVMFALAVFYYGGLKAVFLSTVISLMGILAIAILNMVYPLPANIQRSLSFIPGTWEKVHVEDADQSTEWRVEIWIEALTSNKWIKNKVLGDGLGFTREELSRQQALREGVDVGTGGSGFDVLRESILINGSYHSGPVSLVRTTGYVGLSLFTISMLILAFKAHRLILEFRQTRYFGYLCVLCIPMVYHPLYFLLIFGDFRSDVPEFLIHAGLFTLISRALRENPDEEESDEDETGPAPIPGRFNQLPQQRMG